MRNNLLFERFKYSLRQTNRISLKLSNWIPIISIGIFSLVGFYKSMKNRFLSFLFFFFFKSIRFRELRY